MKKQDLLDVLAAKYHKIGDATKQAGAEVEIQPYRVMVHKLNGENLNRFTVSFFVEKEGTVDEAAYWNGKEPETVGAGAVFQADVSAYIKAKITDDTFKSAFGSNMDLVSERALMWVHRVDGTGQLLEEKIVLFRDGAVINHTKIDVVVKIAE